MDTEPKWQIDMRFIWESAPLEDLLDEALRLAIPDGNGIHTSHGWDEFQFAVELLKERMQTETLNSTERCGNCGKLRAAESLFCPHCGSV